MMMNFTVSADTQAILLLCGSFGENRQAEPQPLTLKEYNILAKWLHKNQMRPQDLLTPNQPTDLKNLASEKLDPTRIESLLERGAKYAFAIEQWTNQGVWILGRGDAEYPRFLKQRLKHSAPAILYGVGEIELLSKGGLAVVGSRDIDEEAVEYTQQIARICAKEEIQIISGGAKGVDQASMLGILEAGGNAIGVLADSLLKAATLGKYRDSIREGQLTLISTYDPNAGFSVGNAMGRNKYIYALANYALVISSSVGKGGTWAGAIEALEKMKDVPLWVRMEDNVPEGNQQLVEQGARAFKLIEWNDYLHNFLSKPPELIEKTIEEEKEAETISENVSNLEVNLETHPAETAEKLVENESISAPNTLEEPISSVSPAEEIYQAVLPILLKHLQEPLDDKSLTERLDVQIGQMREWLKKAVAENKVEKLKNPAKTYVIADKNLLDFINSSPM
ncbi:DNA-processing protein DprA [Limnoraphis robusta Tam1]|uniref:DNA-processing protein DprA n=1 Tax=Limnoraphis robusta TaxID=1118279 RepID=UPI002B2034CF|nr:DNA-processing protein DprA [Limnoraphis robusta]MEA5499518.1 DNA-processing protein DprA [Limnoraphis robusta BA-68 BA1]MEA5538715.1 DNA-processing protein DprA [Limnoraphis robusta Tam1]